MLGLRSHEQALSDKLLIGGMDGGKGVVEATLARLHVQAGAVGAVQGGRSLSEQPGKRATVLPRDGYSDRLLFSKFCNTLGVAVKSNFITHIREL